MHPAGKESSWLTTSRCCGRNSVSVIGRGNRNARLFFLPLSFLFPIVSMYILQELRGGVAGDVLSTANFLSCAAEERTGLRRCCSAFLHVLDPVRVTVCLLLPLCASRSWRVFCLLYCSYLCIFMYLLLFLLICFNVRTCEDLFIHLSAYCPFLVHLPGGQFSVCLTITCSMCTFSLYACVYLSLSVFISVTLSIYFFCFAAVFLDCVPT